MTVTPLTDEDPAVLLLEAVIGKPGGYRVRARRVLEEVIDPVVGQLKDEVDRLRAELATAQAQLAGVRNQVLTEGAELLKAQHDGLFAIGGGGVAAGVLISADLLLAARTAPDAP